MYPTRRSFAVYAMALALSLFPVSAGIPGLDLDTTAAATVDSASMAKELAGLFAVEKALTYQTGEVKLEDGLAVVKLPDGYRYLDPRQSATVLTELWGNPPGSTCLGMLWAPGQTPMGDDSWAVIIQFEEDGYVKDDDADKIDYDDLLKDMQASVDAGNEDRVKAGYAPMRLVGWAEKPFYDKAEHKLHWAKELRLEGSERSSLNYNIRILGRRGVLVLNAVAPMAALAAVKEGIPGILKSVEFQEGHRYSEFNPDVDKVATYGIAGLVAGGVLAKVGFFKVLIAGILAGKKFIFIGGIALLAFARRFFRKPEAQKEIKEVVKKI